MHLDIAAAENSIVEIQLTDRSEIEVIVVFGNGEIALVSFATGQQRLIHTLGFSVDGALEIHSFGRFICIAQKHGLLGVVLDLENEKFQKDLKRGEYLVDHCRFPIGFYPFQDRTHLIHGTDWNRLDITCLETDELLTDRIVDFESQKNYFDYFHSSIVVSPDFSQFTSNGWVWHPFDIITVYPVEAFIQRYEASHLDVKIGDFGERGGYNWDRPLCWLNNFTLGIGHNEGEKSEGEIKFTSQILIYDLRSDQIVDRIPFDGFEVEPSGEAKGDLYFDSKNKHFVGINQVTGLLVTDDKGKILRQDKTLTNWKISLSHNILFHLVPESHRVEFQKVLI